MAILQRGLSGILGGLAGALAMHQFRLLWEGRRSASPDSGIFGFDYEADIHSVDELCARLCLPVFTEPDALKFALLLHYGFGAAAGAIYGLLRSRSAWSDAQFSATFGILLWAFGDELAMSATGLSNPRTRTASSHVSALFAHLLFSSVTELTTRLLKSRE